MCVHFRSNGSPACCVTNPVNAAQQTTARQPHWPLRYFARLCPCVHPLSLCLPHSLSPPAHAVSLRRAGPTQHPTRQHHRGAPGRPPTQSCELRIFDTSSALTRSASGAEAGTLSGWKRTCESCGSSSECVSACVECECVRRWAVCEVPEHTHSCKHAQHAPAPCAASFAARRCRCGGGGGAVAPPAARPAGAAAGPGSVP